MCLALACFYFTQELCEAKHFALEISVALATTPKDFLTPNVQLIQQATNVIVATRVTETEHKLAQVFKECKTGKPTKTKIIKLMGKMQGYEKEFADPAAVEGWETLGHPQLVKEVGTICGEVQKAAKE